MDLFKKKKAEEVSGGGFSKPPEIPLDAPAFVMPEKTEAPMPAPDEIPGAPKEAAGKFTSAAPLDIPMPTPAPVAAATKPEAPFPPKPEVPEAPEKSVERAGELDDEFMPKSGEPTFGPRAEGNVFAEGAIKITDPELFRAFAEIVSNRAAVEVIEALIKRELSIAELVEASQMDENSIQSIVQRLHALGMLKATWYQTKDGKHFNKYKFTDTSGTVKFDLRDLKETLSVEELEAKSTKLVALVTAEGKVPKSLVMSALGLNNDALLDQVIRFAETFKLPDVGDMITGEAPTTEEPDKLKKADEKESAKLYSELEELEGYLKKIK